MRIVFMGTPDFAVPSLKALIREGYEIAGVFTQPDRPKGRGNKLAPGPVKTAALEAGIPVFQPERIRKTGVEDLRGLKPDLCVTAAFGQILSRETLDIPPLGNINVHASLLPKHRGAAPIAYAIMAGDAEAGVTTMMMDAGIDTGDILLREAAAVGESETCGELTARLSEIGADLLIRTIRQLEAGTLKRIPQTEADMTYDPMLTKDLGRPDWTRDADKVRGLINGLNPWPCVTVPWEGGRLKLLRAVRADETAAPAPAPGMHESAAFAAAPGPSESAAPGTVLRADPKAGLVIACGSGAVQILELQAPGGKRMKAEDYLRGHSIPVGTNLREEAE